ncbi:MAG: alpha/beta hydrolase [Pseudomonadota bacterium]
MEAAPLFNDVAEGPEGGAGYWLTADDGLRIRMAVWPEGGAKGTVFIFPGRTEYAEKYGRAAKDFAARGYASLSIDWRGQGLADRMLGNTRIGHVMRFQDYQHDVAAVFDAARQLDLPRPWFLLAHSMGGCIGLRAVMEGIDVEAVAFSAPMWGVQISVPLRPVAWTLSSILPPLGLGNLRSPGTRHNVYVLDEPFEDNVLTNDLDMWKYMGRHASAHGELSLGSPSIIWLREALREMLSLARRPAPNLPCTCFLGTNERIVDPGRIKARMAAWPGGKLVEFPEAEHEVIMEEPAVRKRVFDEADTLFQSAVSSRAA